MWNVEEAKKILGRQRKGYAGKNRAEMDRKMFLISFRQGIILFVLYF